MLLNFLLLYERERDQEFDMEISISKFSEERIDISTIPYRPLAPGEDREITERLFNSLNKTLGEGELIQGHLEKPGVVNELKKILFVLAVFVVLVVLACLGMFLFR